MGGKYHLSLLLLLLLAACSDDPSAPAPVRLSISPSILDFGPVNHGLSLVLPIIVRNTGGSETRVAAFTIDGPDASLFRLINESSLSIGPGEEALIEIRFSPTEPGRRSARLRMIGGMSDTFQVALSGLGIGNVVARLVDSPPLVDGDPADPTWSIAAPLPLRFEQVAGRPDPFSSSSDRAPFDGSIRAVYTADSLYLLLSWQDPTTDVTPDLWRLGGGGWSRAKPGQDGASLIFPIGPDVGRFDREGCAVSCHATGSLGEYEQGHRPERGAIDIWYWTAGQSDPLGIAWDQWADAVAGGRRPDREEDRIEPNHAPGNPLPLRVWGAGNGGFDPSRFIWGPLSTPFDPTGTNPTTGGAWKAGDSIPGWLLHPPPTAVGGVRARGRRHDGGWSVEFSRALLTSEATDVQFDIRRPWHFSIALHDGQKKFTPAEYASLPSLPNPSHYGVYLIGLILD